MVEAIAFDSHRFIKRLTSSGFTETQAETLADEHVTLINSNLATKSDIEALHHDIETLRLATKSDIEALHHDIETLRLATKRDIETMHHDIETLRLATKRDIEAMRLEIKSDIENLRLAVQADIAKVEGRIEAGKVELLKWMLAAMIAQGGLIVALVKLL